MGKVIPDKSPMVRIVVASGHSRVPLTPAIRKVDAKGHAEKLAKDGVWVDPMTFWPAHTITSISMEPIANGQAPT